MLEAAKNGLKVARPMMTERYDLIVDSGGALHKVQVKSTGTIKTHRAKYEVTLKASGKKYTKEEIDIFAVYIKPTNTWYIIPISFCEGRNSISFNLHGHSKVYSEFKEAWHIFFNSAKTLSKFSG